MPWSCVVHNPAHSLWNCLVGDHLLQTKPTQQSHRKRECVNVTGEPHTSQEKKIELQATWSLEAQATAQPQGASSLRIPWGPGPCDGAAERVPLCSPLWGRVVCGFLFHISASFSLSRPASLSIIPWTFRACGGCQNGDLRP